MVAHFATHSPLTPQAGIIYTDYQVTYITTARLIVAYVVGSWLTAVAETSLRVIGILTLVSDWVSWSCMYNLKAQSACYTHKLFNSRFNRRTVYCTCYAETIVVVEQKGVKLNPLDLQRVSSSSYYSYSLPLLFAHFHNANRRHREYKHDTHLYERIWTLHILYIYRTFMHSSSFPRYVPRAVPVLLYGLSSMEDNP